jgi:nitrogen fixation/metabolism regulation signal transduction histidine kinase
MTEKAKPARSRRKIRNYLVYGEYQLHYAGYMALVSGVLTAALGGLVLYFNKLSSQIIDIRALDPTDADAQALSLSLHRNERNLLIGLIAFGVLVAAVLAIWQIATTHRVAGPLYYIAHQTKRMRDGFLGKLHPLRKADMLHGFFENFREMHEAMRSRAQIEAEKFKNLADQADKGGLFELGAELRTMGKQREASLSDLAPYTPPDASGMGSQLR